MTRSREANESPKKEIRQPNETKEILINTKTANKSPSKTLKTSTEISPAKKLITTNKTPPSKSPKITLSPKVESQETDANNKAMKKSKPSFAIITPMHKQMHKSPPSESHSKQSSIPSSTITKTTTSDDTIIMPLKRKSKTPLAKSAAATISQFEPMNTVKVIRDEYNENFLRAHMPSLKMKSALKDRSEMMSLSRVSAISAKSASGKSEKTADNVAADSLKMKGRLVKCGIFAIIVVGFLVTVGVVIYFLFGKHKDETTTALLYSIFSEWSTGTEFVETTTFPPETQFTTFNSSQDNDTDLQFGVEKFDFFRSDN